MTDIWDARMLAEEHLAAMLPRRWRHVRAVGVRAEAVARQLRLEDGALAAAAWLHDIGYCPDLVDTGFHPLDGPRFLRKTGVDDRIVRLVAHHLCAVYEARVRGLEAELLAEFDREESVTYDALVYCDLTTSPEGDRVGFLDRMEEIRQRYGPVHEVTVALDLAPADLTARCTRTLERLQGVGQPM